MHVTEKDDLTPLDRNTAAINRLAASIEGVADAILKSVECPDDEHEVQFPGDVDNGPPPADIHHAAVFASAASPTAIPVQVAAEPEVCSRTGGCCRAEASEGRHRKPELDENVMAPGVKAVAR